MLLSATTTAGLTAVDTNDAVGIGIFGSNRVGLVLIVLPFPIFLSVDPILVADLGVPDTLQLLLLLLLLLPNTVLLVNVSLACSLPIRLLESDALFDPAPKRLKPKLLKIVFVLSFGDDGDGAEAGGDKDIGMIVP